jgi:hypothetical protein
MLRRERRAAASAAYRRGRGRAPAPRWAGVEAGSGEGGRRGVGAAQTGERLRVEVGCGAAYGGSALQAWSTDIRSFRYPNTPEIVDR